MPIGPNTSKSLTLLPRATQTLVKAAGQEPLLRGVGDAVLQALSTAMPLALRATEATLERMPAPDLDRLEERVTAFHVGEDLEAAIQLGENAAGPGLHEIIDIIKGIIKKVKHFLPIPAPWVLIIDEILELINKLLKLFVPGSTQPHTLQPPIPYCPPDAEPILECGSTTLKVERIICASSKENAEKIMRKEFNKAADERCKNSVCPEDGKTCRSNHIIGLTVACVAAKGACPGERFRRFHCTATATVDCICG